MPISIDAFNKFQADLTVIDNPAKGEKGYVDEADTAVVRKAFDVFKIGDEIPYYSPPFKDLRAWFKGSHLTWDNLPEVASLALRPGVPYTPGLHVDVKPHKLVPGATDVLVSVTVDDQVGEDKCTNFILVEHVTYADGSGFYQQIETSAVILHAGGPLVDTPLPLPRELDENTLVEFTGHLLPEGCVPQDSDTVAVKMSYAPKPRPQ